MEGGDVELINDDDDDEILLLNLINFDFFEEIDFPLLPIVACSSSSSNDQVEVEVEVEEEKNSNTPNSSSDSCLIDEVEKYLMKEDDEEEEEEEGRKNLLHMEEDNFFSDFLLDIPIDQSVEPTPPTTTTTTTTTTTRVVSNDEDCSKNPPPPPPPPPPESSNVVSSSSDDDDDHCIQEENNKESDNSSDQLKDGENDDDQITKKRKRQMRNRDAALRSRERKKLYVKDLEIKSRYLESECKRLQHLLQCYAAENQSLHHHLHLQKKNKAASVNNKQESAVLLLESLLLGSLLWLMGSICLFSLPGLLFHHPNPPPADVLVSVGSDSLVEVVSLRAKNRRIGFRRLLKFLRRKRWKATRLKIKEVFPSVADAVTHAVFV